MAKIPTTPPGGAQLTAPKISTQAPSVRQTQAVGAGKGLEAIGRDVERAASFLYQKMDMARNYAENAKADNYKTDYMANLRLIESQKRNADGSPLTDINVAPFQEELKKGKEGLKEIYTNKDELFKAQMNWDRDALVVTNNVLKERYKNIGIVGDVATRTKLDSLINAYAMGDDKALKRIEVSIKEAEANNIYDPKQAYTLRVKTIDNAKFNRFLNDFHNNPTEAAKNVDQYGMSIEQKEKARKISKDAERIVNENRAVNYSMAMENALNGYLTEDEVNRLVDVDKINPGTGIKQKDALNLKKAIVRGITGAIAERAMISSSAKEYMTACKLIFSGQPKEKTEAYKKLLDIYSDEIVDAEEDKYLKQLSDTAKDVEKYTTMEPLQHWWEGMLNRFDETREERIKTRIANQVKSVLTDIRKGDDLDTARKKLDKEILLSVFPDYTSYPKEGKVKVNDAGQVIRVFSDGTYKEE